MSNVASDHAKHDRGQKGQRRKGGKRVQAIAEFHGDLQRFDADRGSAMGHRHSGGR
jgi:hypothetical protein